MIEKLRLNVTKMAAILFFATAASVDLPARAATHRFQASDFPALAEGINVARDGLYAVKIWGPARVHWTATLTGDTLELAALEEGDDITPRFQTAGEVMLHADRRVKIICRATVRNAAERISGVIKAEKGAAVPAFFILSSDSGADPMQALELVRGRIDSIAPPEDPRRTHVRTLDEGAGFRPPSTLELWELRARDLRDQIAVALGLRPLLTRTPLHPRVYDKVVRDGYTIEKVVLETFPGFALAGNLYRPIGKSGRLPAVLCPHGHAKEGRVNVDVQHRAIGWAKLGCVAFTYDMVGFADSKAFGHSFLNDRLRKRGLSLATLQTWNSLRVLDWVSSLGDVDSSRIGCTGESGGGTQTFLLTAIDDRVTVAAPVVMVSDKMQGGSPCENAPGLRIGTDNVEIAALAAPRPMKLIGATGDWTAATMSDAFPKIRDVYSLYGMPNRVAAEVFDFPHNYNQTSRNAVYPFMAHWLLGIDDPAASKEGSQTTEQPDDLHAFGPLHPAPAGLKTPRQLESYLIDAIDEKVQAMAPSADPAAWEANRRLLRMIHKIRIGIVHPGAATIAQSDVRVVRRPGFVASHHLIGRTDAGERIAVIRYVPARSAGRLTVISGERGKDDLVKDDGSPIDMVQQLLERGHEVVGFDPLLVGESVDSAAPQSRRPDTEHFETYNRSLACDQMQDLATVIAWANALPAIHQVNLIATGLAGPQALAARPSLSGIARTAIDAAGFDARDDSRHYPPRLDISGLLQFGGLEACAAFCPGASLWIHGTGRTFDSNWPTKSYAQADCSHLLRVHAGPATPEAIVRWIDTGD